jgi:hypothetical protein
MPNVMSRAAASFSSFLHPVQVFYAEEETIVGGFNKGRQRQLYHMELDPDDADDQDVLRYPPKAAVLR